jgi:hypothetical protein
VVVNITAAKRVKRVQNLVVTTHNGIIIAMFFNENIQTVVTSKVRYSVK